jgi:hypothetical protein
MLADWDDVDTAVDAGAARAECAAGKGHSNPEGTFREYSIKHVSGRAGSVVVSSERAGPDPRPVRVSCQMGPMRDEAIERTVVRAIVRRLDQLRGKEYAPAE